MLDDQLYMCFLLPEGMVDLLGACHDFDGQKHCTSGRDVRAAAPGRIFQIIFMPSIYWELQIIYGEVSTGSCRFVPNCQP